MTYRTEDRTGQLVEMAGDHDAKAELWHSLGTREHDYVSGLLRAEKRRVMSLKREFTHPDGERMPAWGVRADFVARDAADSGTNRELCDYLAEQSAAAGLQLERPFENDGACVGRLRVRLVEPQIPFPFYNSLVMTDEQRLSIRRQLRELKAMGDEFIHLYLGPYQEFSARDAMYMGHIPCDGATHSLYVYTDPEAGGFAGQSELITQLVRAAFDEPNGPAAA